MPDQASPADVIPPATNSAAALTPAFRRLAWSNLAAQSAEQIGLSPLGNIDALPEPVG